MIRSVTVGLRASTSPLVRRAGPPTTTPAAAYSGIGARLKGMFGGSGSSEPAPEAADASAKPKSSLLDSLMNMGSGLTSGMGQIMSKSITPEMLRQQAQELTVPKYIEFMEKSQSGMASKVASFVNPAAAAAASSGELQKRQLAVLKYLTPDEADNIANLTRGQMEVIANRTGQGLVAVSEAIQAYSSIRMFIHFLAHCKENNIEVSDDPNEMKKLFAKMAPDLIRQVQMTPIRRSASLGQSNTLPNLVAKRVIGPNDPCPCGSGQKLKKCCKPGRK